MRHWIVLLIVFACATFTAAWLLRIESRHSAKQAVAEIGIGMDAAQVERVLGEPPFYRVDHHLDSTPTLSVAFWKVAGRTVCIAFGEEGVTSVQFIGREQTMRDTLFRFISAL